MSETGQLFPLTKQLIDQNGKFGFSFTADFHTLFFCLPFLMWRFLLGGIASGSAKISWLSNQNFSPKQSKEEILQF